MTRDERLDRIEQAIKNALDDLRALREEDQLRSGLYGVQLAVDELDLSDGSKLEQVKADPKRVEIPEGLHDSNADGFWDTPGCTVWDRHDDPEQNR